MRTVGAAGHAGLDGVRHEEGLARHVYIGLETGQASLLEWMKKPVTPEAVIRCVRQLKECDIMVGVIVLVGAGGQENAGAHLQETARVINQLPLGRNDFV